MGIKEIEKLISEAEVRLKSIETERNEVLSTLQDLRRKKEEILHKHSTPSISKKSISQDSPSAAKIALFHSFIPDDEERLLIATGRYLGEGFDDARLDSLFLTLPISWKGTIAQYAGRLHRFHYNKKDVRIYDYIDPNVPMLERMYKRRLRGYQAIGYDVVESSSVSKS